MDPYISGLELAQRIKSKEISPLEAVDFYLDRTDKLNDRLNAVTWRRDDDVRADFDGRVLGAKEKLQRALAALRVDAEEDEEG